MNSGIQGGEGKNSGRRAPILDADFLTELQKLSQTQLRFPLRRRRQDSRKSLFRPALAKKTAVDRATVPTPEQTATFPNIFRNLLQPNGHTLTVFVDASETMERASKETGLRKYDQACRIAAALAVSGLSRYDAVQVIALGHARSGRAPIFRKSPDSVDLLMKHLSAIRPGGKGSFAHVIDRYAMRSSGTAVCVVLSDFLTPEWEHGIRRLINSARLRPTLIQILDPFETATASLLDLCLVDPLTKSEKFLAGTYQTDAVYSNALDNYCLEFATLCRQEGIDYLRITTDTAFEQDLIGALK